MLEELDANVVRVTMGVSLHHKFGKNLGGVIKRRIRDTTLFAGDHHATFSYPQILRSDLPQKLNIIQD